MAPSNTILTFFTRMREQGGIVVEAIPKLDLDLYIQNYQGRTKFDRLFHVGRSSVPLCVDALKAALVEAKKGKDLHRYREVVECLAIAAPDEPEAIFDHAWADATESSSNSERVRLEAELKGYKNNLIKESIRMGNEDIGKHLENTGDLHGAIEAYSKMRPDVSTSKQIIDVGRHLISVHLQRRDWPTVLGNVNKITGLQNSDEEKAIQPYLKVVQGIAFLGQDKYPEATLCFLQTEAESHATVYGDVASQNDVAIYGGLLALATMNRHELQSIVLDSDSFRSFLELEPHIRKAITLFVNGRYSSCLAILESYRADYLLDIYLQPHVATIYGQIRSKCIIHYLQPFSCVTLDSMNAAFSDGGRPIEEELVAMIRNGSLKAKIDAIDKVVTTMSADSRTRMQRAGLETAREFEKEALERIRRMSLAAAELDVRGGRKLISDLAGDEPIVGAV